MPTAPPLPAAAMPAALIPAPPLPAPLLPATPVPLLPSPVPATPEPAAPRPARPPPPIGVIALPAAPAEPAAPTPAIGNADAPAGAGNVGFIAPPVSSPPQAAAMNVAIKLTNALRTNGCMSFSRTRYNPITPRDVSHARTLAQAISMTRVLECCFTGAECFGLAKIVLRLAEPAFVWLYLFAHPRASAQIYCSNLSPLGLTEPCSNRA
jgi:hypothetical protein